MLRRPPDSWSRSNKMTPPRPCSLMALTIQSLGPTVSPRNPTMSRLAIFRRSVASDAGARELPVADGEAAGPPTTCLDVRPDATVPCAAPHAASPVAAAAEPIPANSCRRVSRAVLTHQPYRDRTRARARSARPPALYTLSTVDGHAWPAWPRREPGLLKARWFWFLRAGGRTRLPVPGP